MCVTLAGRVRSVGRDGLAEVEVGPRIVRASIVLCPAVRRGQWVSFATGLVLRPVTAREARWINALVGAGTMEREQVGS